MEYDELFENDTKAMNQDGEGDPEMINIRSPTKLDEENSLA